MAKHRQITTGNPIPQDWLDAVQEFIGTQASPNLVLSIFNPTTLQAVAGVGNAQVAVGINGKWRWNSATAQATPPGSPTLITGDNDVYVVASDNSFSGSGAGEVDSTDYTFRLKVLPPGSTPSGTGTEALYRKIGIATWTGSAFTDVRQTVGGNALPRHAATHNPGAVDALSWPSIAQTIAGVGTLATRPTAAAGNNGYLFFATDASGGTWYQSDGSAWNPRTRGLTALPLSHASTHLPGGADPLDLTQINRRGTLAARPTYSATYNGVFYWATDVQTLYRGESSLSAWERVSSGVQVVTTIGSAVAYDSAVVRVRAGATPFDFTTLIYDATYGKWVETQEWTAASDTISAVGNKYGASRWFAYKSRYDAGLRLQVRVIGNLSRSTAGGIPALAAGFQGATVTDTTHLTGNVQPTLTNQQGVLDSGWVDLNTGVDNTQVLAELFLRGNGDFSGGASWVGSITCRWVA